MTRNSLPKLFLGPMSKNVIEAVCSYKAPLGLVASRRQIECSGGYVNGFDTLNFHAFVRACSKEVLIERDHAGPLQGMNNDDGLISLCSDAQLFDIIHIDIWKRYRGLEIAAYKTAEYINFCENIKEGLYEVGTEQDIRPYTPKELEFFLSILKKELKNTFDKIIFVVIQSGTSLEGAHNKGVFNEYKLKDMIEVCKNFNKNSKEHNGDYLDPLLIKQKFDLGLDAINIAPELGRIETQIVLEYLKNDPENLDIFYKLCLNSGKWKRWLGNNFMGNNNLLIEVCGHYVFNDIHFKKIIAGKEDLIQIETKKRIHNFIGAIL